MILRLGNIFGYFGYASHAKNGYAQCDWSAHGMQYIVQPYK